jgi:hypothetical protein
MKWQVCAVHPASGNSYRVAGNYPTKKVADVVAKDLAVQRASVDPHTRYVVIRQLGN